MKSASEALSAKYSYPQDKIETELASIKQRYEAVQRMHDDRLLETRGDTYDKRVNPAVKCAVKLRERLRNVPTGPYETSDGNVVEELSFYLAVFLAQSGEAKQNLPGKPNTRAWARTILLNRLERLYQQLTDVPVTCSWSKDLNGYKGTFVTFLEVTLPYFGVAKEDANKFAQHYCKHCAKHGR